MTLSVAIVEFERALESAKALIGLDVSHFADPPLCADLMAVQGLRGGASVLMVAALEQLLRQGFEEHLSRLVSSGSEVRLSTLPDRTRVHNTYKSLDIAMKGKLYEPKRDRIDRLGDIEQAAHRLLSGIVDPSAFSEDAGNPSSARIRVLFKTVDIEDVFVTIQSSFVAGWGAPVARTYIPDNLDAIVQRRHQIAHRATALSIGRVDLSEGVRFIDVLGHSLNDALDGCVNRWIGSTAAPQRWFGFY